MEDHSQSDGIMWDQMGSNGIEWDQMGATSNKGGYKTINKGEMNGTYPNKLNNLPTIMGKAIIYSGLGGFTSQYIRIYGQKY